jgi:hypothetical protein
MRAEQPSRLSPADYEFPAAPPLTCIALRRQPLGSWPLSAFTPFWELSVISWSIVRTKPEQTLITASFPTDP